MAQPNDSAQERTEEATPRRREQARREGRVPKSVELTGAAAIVGAALLLSGGAGQALSGFATRTLVENAGALTLGPLELPGAVAMLRGVALRLVVALLPFAGGLAGLVVLVNLVQTGGVMSLAPVTPKLSHVSPLTGLRRLTSPEAAFNLVKAILKLAVLGWVTWTVIAGAWQELSSLTETTPVAIAEVVRALATRVALLVGLAFAALALADYGFQRLQFEKNLRMSRQEIVQEQRETEGNPLVKARMLALGRARARRRMLQAVPTADVVVVNPTHIAVALRYDLNVAAAPIVVAMGERKLAQRIRDLATKHGVPIVENRPCARALRATATVGRPIPPALYAVVAEILAFVYRQRGGLPARAIAGGAR